MRISKLAPRRLRPSHVQAAIALVVILGAAGFAEYQSREVYRQSQRSAVVDQLALIRARLEGHLNANVQLVQGLVGTIATEPGMDQDRFSDLAQYVLDQQNQLRSVAAAPDLVVDMVYPLDGNRAALGLDYRENVDQREAALRARDAGAMVLAGPVALVQGGEAFVARFPVFSREAEGADAFWGIVSAVIDSDQLYAASGITDPDLGLAVVLCGRDGTGAGGDSFFGDSETLDTDPVTAQVLLPNGSWQLSATPEGGWKSTPPGIWLLRGGMAIAGALVLIPILLVGRLDSERRRRLFEQRRREVELSRISRRLELALSASQVAVWELNLETDELHWDARMRAIYGLPDLENPIAVDAWRSALHPDDVERAVREFRNAVNTGTRYVSTFRIITPQGEVRQVRAIATIYSDPGSVPRMIGVNWDSTADAMLHEALMQAKTQAEFKNAELEAAKERIEYNALHDSLTELPNRRYLDEALERYAAGCTTPDAGVAILHIDLDRFKQINDTLGHAAGDAMLIHAATVLDSCIVPGEFVARIGGDEFVVLCRDRTRDLEALAEDIITRMREPVSYEGHACRFGVSIGIATASGPALDPKQLLVNADIALYRAKRRGRNRFEFFSEALQTEIFISKNTADGILNGLESDQFFAYYQPQFDARTLDIVGLEALARWRHPTRGVLTPDRFMTIAEDLNVVGTLDRLILERALDERAHWLASGIEVPRVSVNVSARRLRDERLIEGLKALDIKPGTVSFELVESIYLDESDDDIVSWNIAAIRDLGIDIEIDDFGTGYASIVSLLKLRPNRLKVDRQLVMPITTCTQQHRLVESIIDIGRSLEIEVIAEGVETHDHAHLLRDMGCSTLQGYAFARPMPPESVESFARAQRWRQAG